MVILRLTITYRSRSRFSTKVILLARAATTRDATDQVDRFRGGTGQPWTRLLKNSGQIRQVSDFYDSTFSDQQVLMRPKHPP